MSSLLKTIREPRDLRTLTVRQLATLSREIRDVLISNVSRNGGHLGPNLGVVELTIALHRVFDSPHDRIIFDVGHQAYVHKLLTGRQDFSLLRKRGGLSGYPSRAESPHDIVENQHASTSLSWADGIARATEITGDGGAVIAVIGDGALTGGMAWEALNNIAAAQDRPVVIVVNDNGHSYQPTVGAFAGYLAKLRTAREYEQTLRLTRSALSGLPVIGEPVFSIAHRAKRAIKDIVAPQHMFEDLGLKYIGPVDGHDQAALERALHSARSFAGPVIVHCITEKGRGYLPAEQADERLHQVGPKADSPAKPAPAATGTDWTAAFAAELVAVGESRPDIVAITAAMTRSTGLEPFAQRFPNRFFDVGIAEQHATTAAAGMATAGLHPVVAIYGTFLNRAFDQIMMDVALHHCGVTFVLPRCGVTGDDGASHNGMWDLAALQVVPGLRIAAPRDTVALQEQLREAVAVADAPTVVRFPKGSAGPAIPAISRIGGVDLIRACPQTSERADVLIVAMGACVELSCTAAEELTQQGYSVTVVDPRWVKPVDPALPGLAAKHRLVVTVEDGVRTGGAGAAITQAITDEQIWVPVHNFGLPVEFLDHGSRSQVLERVRLTAADVTKQIAVILTKLEE